MILLLAVIIGLIVTALSQTSCKCDIGLYAKDNNGECVGKIKDIQIIDAPENCVQVYSSPEYVKYVIMI